MFEHSAKQLPRDPANVNAWKNMCDLYDKKKKDPCIIGSVQKRKNPEMWGLILGKGEEYPQ